MHGFGQEQHERLPGPAAGAGGKRLKTSSRENFFTQQIAKEWKSPRQGVVKGEGKSRFRGHLSHSDALFRSRNT